VSIHDLCKSNHVYYPKCIKSSNIILSVITSYTFKPFNFSYWHSIINCATVLLWYCSTVLLCFCTSVRLSVYSWLVQIQPWLLSKMKKIQQYHFVCNNIIYFQTIQFFLLALYHWLKYRSTVILWYCATILLKCCVTFLPFYCSTVLLYYCTSVRLSVYSWLV
jgi:hypothetical protein